MFWIVAVPAGIALAMFVIFVVVEAEADITMRSNDEKKRSEG